MHFYVSFFSIAILTLANFGMVSARQDTPPIPAEAYWDLVRSTRQTLRESAALPDEEVRMRLENLARAWEAIRVVELADHSLVQVDSSYLVAGLRAESPEIARLQGLLDVLLKAHEEYPKGIFTLQDIEPLKDILARPEFQWGQTPANQTPDWLNGILESIDEFFRRLARRVQNVTYYGRTPLVLALTALFVLAIYFLSRGLSRNLVREAELAAQRDEGDEPLTSKSAIQRAQSLSGRRDYRNAVRYLYLSSLLILDEKGLLRYDRSRTNREVLHSVSTQPEVAAPLRNVIDVFDRVWYGFESVDEESYRGYVQHVDELRERKA